MNKDKLLSLLKQSAYNSVLKLNRHCESHEHMLADTICLMAVIEACKEMYGEISGFVMDMPEDYEDIIEEASILIIDLLCL